MKDLEQVVIQYKLKPVNFEGNIIQ